MPLASQLHCEQVELAVHEPRPFEGPRGGYGAAARQRIEAPVRVPGAGFHQSCQAFSYVSVCSGDHGWAVGRP